MGAQSYKKEVTSALKISVPFVIAVTQWNVADFSCFPERIGNVSM